RVQESPQLARVEIGQREVGRTRSTVLGRGAVADERAEPTEIAPGQAFEGLGMVAFFAVGPADLETAVGDERVDLDEVAAFSQRTARGTRVLRGAGETSLRRPGRIQLAEIVERELGPGQRSQKGDGFRVGGVAEESVPDS